MAPLNLQSVEKQLEPASEAGPLLPIKEDVHQRRSAYLECWAPTASLLSPAAFIKMLSHSLSSILLIIQVKSSLSFLLHLEIFHFMTNNICELVDKPVAMSTRWNTPGCTTWQLFKLLQLYYNSEQNYLGGRTRFLRENQTAPAKAGLYLWTPACFTGNSLFATVKLGCNQKGDKSFSI